MLDFKCPQPDGLSAGIVLGVSGLHKIHISAHLCLVKVYKLKVLMFFPPPFYVKFKDLTAADLLHNCADAQHVHSHLFILVFTKLLAVCVYSAKKITPLKNTP